jgi:hypothetical protein
LNSPFSSLFSVVLAGDICENIYGKPSSWLLSACTSIPTILDASPSTPDASPDKTTSSGSPPAPHLSFWDGGQELGAGETFSISLGDLDGDGDLDAVVANYQKPCQVWTNNGTGVFSAAQAMGESKTGHGVALGDLDGDGDLDVFVALNEEKDQVWLNDGSGNFTDSNQRLGNAEDHSPSVSLVDVDNDGDLDAFATNYRNPSCCTQITGREYYRQRIQN